MAGFQVERIVHLSLVVDPTIMAGLLVASCSKRGLVRCFDLKWIHTCWHMRHV